MERNADHIFPKQHCDRLLTRLEVEARFGIPKRLLELAVSRENGPPIVRIGRLVRYKVSDIQEWIDQLTVGQ